MVPSNQTPGNLYDRINPTLDANDRVLISEITKQSVWRNLRASDEKVKELFQYARS